MNVSDYRSNNAAAFSLLILPLTLLVVGISLIISEYRFAFWLGQLVLSIFFLQTFLLLHECGHLSFFKSKWLNKWFGNLFGFLTLIPYYSWQKVHGLHHRWAGWRDKDPTTTPTAHASESKIKNTVVNIAWKIWLPIFYLAYKIGNYWNLIKIRNYVRPEIYKKIRTNVFVYAIMYALTLFFFWPYVVLIVPAFVLSLLWKEVIIMSQHSHVDMPLAEGKEVKPFSYLDQIQYTRSFYLPSWVSRYLLFNVNLHEAHHAYPGIPAYHLGQVDIQQPAEPKFLDWLVKAKSMKGEDYIFRTSRHTGKKF